jgi:hypothetical protein
MTIEIEPARDAAPDAAVRAREAEMMQIPWRRMQ